MQCEEIVAGIFAHTEYHYIESGADSVFMATVTMETGFAYYKQERMMCIKIDM
jgi:hypothetical protein